MILVMKRSSIMLGVLIVILTASILALNFGFGGNRAESAVTDGEMIPVAGTPMPMPTATTDNSIKTVIIDAGHGGEDPGAVSSFSMAKEKDITLVIAQNTQRLLEEAGYKVIMTRTEDVLNYKGDDISMTSKRRQDLLARKKIMDESNADIVISIHLNSFTDSSYSGAQTFYTKDSLSSKKLAISLQESLRAVLDPENDREALLKKEDIIITKNCKTTTTIVECGFLSNAEEEALLCDTEYQVKISEAIKLGVDAYFSAG
ncbi:MAG: cell wall hydrolase [Ruminococcaceae bacterium]|nr:cell wall hydrolase [Oscillospiraceae bacterium]